MKKYFALAAITAAAFLAMRTRAQENTGLPLEAEATIRAATAQRSPELLDTAAAGYAKLHKYEVAQKLLETSLALRGDASGAGSASYAAGLVKLGELAVERRQFADADKVYAQAVALGDRPEVSTALLY